MLQKTGARKKTKKSRSQHVRRKSVAGRQRVNKPLIANKEAYDLTMKEIDALMQQGENNLDKTELTRLKSLAIAAEAFEDREDPLPSPTGLAELVRMQMFRLKLTQQFTARLLGVSEAKLSLIMNGKQRPDVAFIKALHSKLDLDANQVLEAV